MGAMGKEVKPAILLIKLYVRNCKTGSFFDCHLNSTFSALSLNLIEVMFINIVECMFEFVPIVEIFANLSSISKTTIGDAIKSMSTFFFIVVDVEFGASLNLVGSFTRLVTRMRPMALQLPYRLNKSDRAESWYL
ncbi:hypothetical protein T07_2162 [Trichinella nelsoni]|uniref:Uncharacterized protein n=1 Tax=Trichinella nelsoni TaxID=6336 RepID=A0A0V0SBK3_9BILA|nr:hypothetical protein T07_2162 [Trichinella nelsoni]